MLEGEVLAEFERDLLELGAEILDRDYMTLEPVPISACRHCDFLPRCTRFFDREKEEGPTDGPLSEEGL
jgi:hypothetical protein